MGVNVLTQKLESKSFISFICFLQSANVRTGEDVDDLIMGMASQVAEREDNIVVEDLRGIKPPFFFSAACFKTGTYLQCWFSESRNFFGSAENNCLTMQSRRKVNVKSKTCFILERVIYFSDVCDRLHVRTPEVHSHRPGGRDHPKRAGLRPAELH